MAADRDLAREVAAASPRLRFDHALVAAFDLAAAKSEFESLGFTVIAGGQHSGGLTENALVTFADGNYLELIAPTSRELLERPPPPGPGNYLFLFDAGEGFVGYAFDAPNLDAEVRRLRSNGIDIGDPQPGGRRRPDGVELAWRTAMLPDTRSPFFVVDDTPRERRIREESEITTHPNRAEGVIGIVVPVQNLERAVARHEAILGVPSKPGLPGPGAAMAEFQIGGFRLSLAAPEGDASPLAEHLAHHGQVPYQVQIRTSSPTHVAGLEARGARIELVQDPRSL
ncbi:MAG TPA: VOC family protein [Anaerolineales bacterium]